MIYLDMHAESMYEVTLRILHFDVLRLRKAREYVLLTLDKNPRYHIS